MSPETEIALRASIKHWEENAAVTLIEDADTKTRSCALCRLFFDSGCVGCPVSEKTGQRSCGDTPYKAANDAKFDGDLSLFILAAKAELDFLRSLLPDMERPA